MHRLTIVFSLAALLVLSACEQREQTQSPGPPGFGSREPVQQPIGAEPVPGPAGQHRGEQAAAPPAGQERTGAAPEAPQQAVGQQAQQPPGQTRETAEFMGQAPKAGDAPETVILEAKNGNVTLSHSKHANMTECKTCHGAAQPGRMADFNKDKAHALCQGCHKEKGAGPTKCQECHKKQ